MVDVKVSQSYTKENGGKVGGDIVVLPTGSTQLDETLSHQPVIDYEDLLQYRCAVEGKYEMIVTNNKRDFLEFCELPIYTSKEFLLHFFRQ